MIVYVTIAMQLSEDADPEEVVNEMDYDFKHEDILNTEVLGYEEKA